MIKNKLGLIGAPLAGMMFLSGCASPTETNKNQATESAPTSGNTAESPYEVYTATAEATEKVPSIESLFGFGPEGTVSSGNMTTRISKKIVDALGIKGVEAEDKVTENIYKVTMVYFAWELATQGESTDPKLEIFINLTVDDLGSLEKVLAVYEQNKSLGENGFDYTFDFGTNNIKTVDPALTDRPDKITGKVEKIQCSELYDYKEMDSLIEYLNKNKIDYTTINAFNMNISVIFFDSNGILNVYTTMPGDYLNKDIYNNEDLAVEVFAYTSENVLQAGQYAIGEQFPNRGRTTLGREMALDLYTYDDNEDLSEGGVYKFTY